MEGNMKAEKQAASGISGKKEILELLHDIEFSNMHTKNIFEILDGLLYDFSGVQKDIGTTFKFIEQANTLLDFGGRQALLTDEKLSLLSSRLLY